MNDIIERLREFGTEQSLYPLCTEAAEEIERLTAALQRAYRWIDPACDPSDLTAYEMAQIIRAALEGKP